jgi:hypothetical protein
MLYVMLILLAIPKAGSEPIQKSPERAGADPSGVAIQLEPIPLTGPTRRSPGMRDGADLARIGFRMRARWMSGPVELRFPEVLQSTQGYHFLDHFRDTIQPIHELDAYPAWKRESSTGEFRYTCRTREGVVFRGSARPVADGVELVFQVRNETGKPMEYAAANMCLHLGGCPEMGGAPTLNRLFTARGGTLFPLSRTTPTPQQMGRTIPWLLLLTREGEKTFAGPKVSSTWWRVEQIAEENLMAAVSADGKRLIGYAWDTPAETQMMNGGNPCLHTGPGAVRRIAPGTTHTWRGKIYLLHNNSSRLLALFRANRKEWARMREQEERAQAKREAEAEIRPPKSDADRRFWLENMAVYHGYTREEMALVVGGSPAQIAQDLMRLGITPGNRQPRPPDAPLRVLPYPGGRHPRIGFLDGAIHPQRETKISVFTPWDDTSYAVVDVPEAIFSNLGLIYLAHTHVPTLWDQQGITLPKQEWERHPNGILTAQRTLPNGIAFGAKIEPTVEGVKMELWLRNGTSETLTDLRVQNCVMLKGAKGFSAQTGDNKLLRAPFAACRSEDGTRWIITAWERCVRAWQNPPCPCFHSDPQFADCPPGETVRLQGWLSFYAGSAIEEELNRLEKRLPSSLFRP